jgi:hypothetical protein
VRKPRRNAFCDGFRDAAVNWLRTEYPHADVGTILDAGPETTSLTFLLDFGHPRPPHAAAKVVISEGEYLANRKADTLDRLYDRKLADLSTAMYCELTAARAK